MEKKRMTPRDIRSQKTKDSILKASIKILSKYGADGMTVKNICDEAGVSNGTFYHFFNSKDDIYSYFLFHNHTEYIEKNEARLEQLNFKEKILDLYLMHVDLCLDLGIAFTAAYYNTSNSGLDAIHRSNPPGTFYIMDKCAEYARQAKLDGYVRQDLDISEFRLLLGAIAIGVMSQWCTTKGELDPKAHLRVLINSYLNSVMTDKFRRDFPESC